MTLPPGQYTISSFVRQEGQYIPVGRALAEDRSLSPKRVVASTGRLGITEWFIEPYYENDYKLSIGRSPTAVIDSKLYAILLGNPAAEKWVIESHPSLPPNVFTIERKGGRREGWVYNRERDDGYGSQINVRPLIAGPRDPPFFPPNELWVIEPVY